MLALPPPTEGQRCFLIARCFSGRGFFQRPTLLESFSSSSSFSLATFWLRARANPAVPRACKLLRWAHLGICSLCWELEPGIIWGGAAALLKLSWCKFFSLLPSLCICCWYPWGGGWDCTIASARLAAELGCVVLVAVASPAGWGVSLGSGICCFPATFVKLVVAQLVSTGAQN